MLSHPARPPAAELDPSLPEAGGAAPLDDLQPDPPAKIAPQLDLARSDARRTLLLVLAVVLLSLFLLPPAHFTGLWDPHELKVADLARRIAINLHGASGLTLADADNSLPHLNDLGRPQLAFTSIALGFKLFGLHEWAGRLPLLVWAALGAIALYGGLSRLVHPRAGLFAAIALVTTPLYFVQARTMLGDIVALSAFSMAWSGLAVAVLDDDSALKTRALWFLFGVLGLLAGYFSRGALLGVAVPMLSVGLPWALAQGQGRGGHVFARVLGVALTVLGLAIAINTTLLLPKLSADSDLSPWVGAMIQVPSKLPTFDVILAQIGHGTAPWSALYPLALGRLFWASTFRERGAQGAIEWRRTACKTSIVVGASVSVILQGSLLAYTEPAPFVGLALLAAAVGVALFDYERGAPSSLLIGLGVLVLAMVLQHDFKKIPDKGFAAFAVSASFPDTLKQHAEKLWFLVFAAFGGLSVMTFLEQHSERRTFDAERYFEILARLRRQSGGSLAMAYFAVVATTSVAGCAIWLGTRLRVPVVLALSPHLRERITLAWWAVALLPGLLFFGLLLLIDLWHFVFAGAGPLGGRSVTRGLLPLAWLTQRMRRASPSHSFFDDGPRVVAALCLLLLALGLAVPLAMLQPELSIDKRLMLFVMGLCAVPVLLALAGLVGDLVQGSRAAGLLVFGAVLGTVLAVDYYPALANQLSPREVFRAYRKAKRADEPLAVLNVGTKTVAYYAGQEPAQLTDSTSAVRWLAAAPDDGRRFLVLRNDDLVRANQLWREQAKQNLPLLDARSAQTLLAASSLLPGEQSHNPLDVYLLPAAPKPSHPLEVNLDGKLRVLGFDWVTESGQVVSAITASKEYTMKIYFEVTAKVGRDWEGFVHIDGQRRRHNGDHKVCDGKLPTSSWLPGDYVVDAVKIKLGPNFGAGDYDIYFGFYQGDTRMRVASGPSDGGNRVHGGKLKVR